ncbi:jg5776 [Pararge aegeria aegeria]|uniref:Jg5776 protein n=1 Tax=Pararge aegeria aegeria TaxID=348720 RepID=A0A8S4SNJ3_9NEOP|nr:jg5776 [Pararge aegeria aegeria]
MKVLFFTFLLVAVGADVLPPQYLEDKYNTREQRIVTNQIKKAIEQLSKDIKDAGLDPLEVDQYEVSTSPVPILVTISAFVESLSFTGASNIAINRLDYGALTNRLRFDISLPQIRLSIGDAGVKANVFGTSYTGQLKGNIEITQLRLAGEIRMNVGIISGISIRSVEVNFRMQKIQSAWTLIVQDKDYSAEVNTILNEMIPELLETFKDIIDKNLSDLIKEVGNQILEKSLFIDADVTV